MTATFRAASRLTLAFLLCGTASAREAAATEATAAAAAAAPRVRFLAEVRYDVGLTNAVDVQFADGHSESLRANGGWVLAAGAALRPTASDVFHLIGTIGLKYDAIRASNGSVRYLAYPVELLAAASVPNARLSAGLSVSLAPSFSGSGAATTLDLPLKSSLGIVGRAEWVHAARPGGTAFSLGLRFALERMQAEAGGPVSDANTIGFVAGLVL